VQKKKPGNFEEGYSWRCRPHFFWPTYHVVNKQVVPISNFLTEKRRNGTAVAKVLYGFLKTEEGESEPADKFQVGLKSRF
jgi:hypothetical protein